MYNIFTIANPNSISFFNVIKSLCSLKAFVVNCDLMTTLYLKAILPRAFLSLSHEIFLTAFQETSRISHWCSANFPVFHISRLHVKFSFNGSIYLIQ